MDGHQNLCLWCGSKDGHWKRQVQKEIGLCGQGMLTILDSMVFVISDHLTSMRIFMLIMNMKFIRASKVIRQMATCTIWICNTCVFMSYEK